MRRRRGALNFTAGPSTHETGGRDLLSEFWLVVLGILACVLTADALTPRDAKKRLETQLREFGLLNWASLYGLHLLFGGMGLGGFIIDGLLDFKLPLAAKGLYLTFFATFAVTATIYSRELVRVVRKWGRDARL